MSNKGLLFRDTILCTLFTLIIAGLLYFVFVNISFLNVFSRAFGDFEFTDIYYSRQLGKRETSKNIILVNVGHVDRAEIAKAIEIVSRQNPKVIGLDMIFKDLKSPASDSLLRKALQKTHIVTSYGVHSDTLTANHPFFTSPSGKSGFVNVLPKEDYLVIRDVETWKLSSQKDTLISFPAQIAFMHTPGLRKETLKLSSPIPIDYIGNIGTGDSPGSFMHFDIPDILSRQSIPVMEKAIVIFGYLGHNPHDIEDKHFTPMNPVIAGKSLPDMYGAVIHANIIKTLIPGNTPSYLLKVSRFWTYFWALLSCMVFLFWGLQYNKKRPVLFEVTLKIIQFLLSIIILFIALLLLKARILLTITPVLALTILGLEMINFFKSLMHYLKEKYAWKSYLLD